MGGVAPEPGDQIGGADPTVGSAHSGGVHHRQRGGVDLGAVIGGHGVGDGNAQLLEGTPQPAQPPVDFGLVGQVREQPSVVSGDLGQEPGLTAPTQQLSDQRDRDQLGITAHRRRAWPGWDLHLAGGDRVIDEHVDVDEQI